MTKSQKDLVRACAEETSELIKIEIVDRWFAVLVDEARDASIKEEMTMVVRYISYICVFYLFCFDVFN